MREARLEDKDQVLGIHDNVYEGFDYLPLYYDHFVAANEITPFVLLHKDTIVSFNLGATAIYIHGWGIVNGYAPLLTFMHRGHLKNQLHNGTQRYQNVSNV